MTGSASAGSATYTPLQIGSDTDMDAGHKLSAIEEPARVPVEYLVSEGAAGRCRWGPFTPDCCQTFRRPAWFLVCLCWAGFVQGMVVNGFVNVVISTLERRYQISSTETGTIASCYDMAAVLCLIPVSYLGGLGRKPVYLAVGMLVLGAGSFVFSLPHYSSPLYDVGHTEYGHVVCKRGGANASSCSSFSDSLSSYKYVFFLGQLLHGAGASPLYTLGITFLDDNLPVRSTSLYQGIFYAFAIFGPGVGYLLGGAFLNFYTDFNRVDMSTVSITNDNPRWVGAWWVGFLVGALLGVVIALPLFGFPKILPGSEEYQAEKEKEVYQGKGVESEDRSLGLKHMIRSAKLQLTNPTFMCLNLAAACEGGIVSGFSTFAPKYIEFQFGLTSGFAAQLVGLVAIPAGGGATFLGGWLVKRFNWDIPRILKFSLIVTVITVFMGFGFLIHCDNLPFAGISATYLKPSTGAGKFMDNVQVNADCNSGCGCSLLDYNPVCGRDDVMYYSPCYAGCNATLATRAEKYTNCSCVVYNVTDRDVAKSEAWQVTEGKCESRCKLLPIFLPIFGIVMIGIFITSMPALTATLRCVAQEQRSFALGIQWIIARCLGSIPGPILFGKVIDMTCRMWQKSCSGQGACLYYDNQQMSYNLLAVGLAYNVLSCLAFLLAFVFYRSSPAGIASSIHISPADVAPGPASCGTSVTTISQPPTPSVEHALNGQVPRLAPDVPRCDVDVPEHTDGSHLTP